MVRNYQHIQMLLGQFRRRPGVLDALTLRRLHNRTGSQHLKFVHIRRALLLYASPTTGRKPLSEKINAAGFL